tara:strand:+ start:897 stop:1649 length:753 start_codon:yes stop_codon:yes gene_type:complete
MNATTLLSQMSRSAAGGGESFSIILIISFLVVGIGMLVFFFSRYQKCPSDRILVIYGKTGPRQSSKCLHGGAAFIWPVIQAYEFLDLTPIPIDIPLEGAPTKQNIRINIPSTFTVGISTDPSVMSNAAERLLGLQLSQVRDLARDMILGSMRYVISTMDIEAINDRDQFIEQIVDGVEGELRRVGLRLINVNIKDITDESGYLESLGKEALSNVDNRINMDVTQEIAALKEELKELKLDIQEIRTNSQSA